MLTNVYLSERFKDTLSIHVMEKLGECDVEYDVRESATGNIDSYEASLKGKFIVAHRLICPNWLVWWWYHMICSYVSQ